MRKKIVIAAIAVILAFISMGGGSSCNVDQIMCQLGLISCG
jgi:hypothetical protein